MLVVPAIDIKDGKCVRLLKGDFNNITQYEKTPFDRASEFFKLGFQNIHLVDLDGALKGDSINKEIIKKISGINKIKLQVGGGIRTLDHISELIDFGVDKVILGTLAVENSKLLEEACKKFNKKIVISLDARQGYIALSGWRNQTKILALDFIKKVEHLNISRIIYTDINRDGTKLGPNIDETVKLSNSTKTPVFISGGISSIKDVVSIKEKNFKNIEGIIIGKAIYDGSINIKELSEII